MQSSAPGRHARPHSKWPKGARQRTAGVMPTQQLVQRVAPVNVMPGHLCRRGAWRRKPLRNLHQLEPHGLHRLDFVPVLHGLRRLGRDVLAVFPPMADDALVPLHLGDGGDHAGRRLASSRVGGRQGGQKGGDGREIQAGPCGAACCRVVCWPVSVQGAEASQRFSPISPALPMAHLFSVSSEI